MRILRVVGSGLLPCGCFVGLYETYDGPTVQIIEERGVRCLEPTHEPGQHTTANPVHASLIASGRATAPASLAHSH